MPQALAPRELIRSAGSLKAVAASVALAATSAASAQNAPANSGSAPWQQKADPKIVDAAFRAADAARSASATNSSTPAADTEQPPAQPGEGAKVTVSDQMTVDLHVKDEPIAGVLEMLALQSQRNIIASKNVTGKVSADLFKVTFREALDSILHVNGFQWVEKGSFIYVYTREEYLEIQKALSKRVAKVIRLNYLNATDAESFVKPLLSQGGDIKTATKTPEFAIAGEAPVGKDDYALGAVLVVIDYEENIAAIEKLLVEIDTRPAQVLVEATILETQVVEANAFGIDFSIIGDLDFLEFANLGGPRAAAQALIRGGSGASGGLSPADNRGGAVSTSPGNTQDGRSTVKIGVIAGPIGVFLRALDDVSDFTVISSPKLLALNRMPSRVLVGQRVGYLNTTATETSTTQTVQFLDTGTTLYFRPFVASTGEIRMELKPKVASATIRDAGNGQGGIVSIPDETTQEITTNVIVKDGNTIVLGGLFVERTTAFRKQVPILGDIPLIGAAFRGHDDSTDRRELIFLIRPQIMGETTLAMQGVDVKNEIERIRAGQRQGLLPFSREKMTSVLNVEAETAAREGRTEEAYWKLQRSLSLNPRQPDAIRLRERITSEKEVWPTNFLLEGVIDGEINRRTQAVPAEPVYTPRRHIVPHGSVNIPREKVAPAAPRSDADFPSDSVFSRTLNNAINSSANPNTNTNTAPADHHADQPDTTQPDLTANALSANSAANNNASTSSSFFTPGDTTLANPATRPGLQPIAGESPDSTNFSNASTGDPMGEQPMNSAHADTHHQASTSPQPHDPNPWMATSPVNPAAPTPSSHSTTDASQHTTTSNASNTSDPHTHHATADHAATSRKVSNLLRPISPAHSGSAQRLATRMSARAFFQALFTGPSTDDASFATTPTDAPRQPQDIAK